MDPTPDATRPLASTSTTDLFHRIVTSTTALVEKQMELAKVEFRADRKREMTLIVGIGVAVVCAMLVLELLTLAAVLAIAERLPGWAAPLVLAVPIIAVGVFAAVFGWMRRVKHPLEKTGETLKQDAQWVKDQIT